MRPARHPGHRVRIEQRLREGITKQIPQRKDRTLRDVPLPILRHRPQQPGRRLTHLRSRLRTGEEPEDRRIAQLVILPHPIAQQRHHIHIRRLHRPPHIPEAPREIYILRLHLRPEAQHLLIGVGDRLHHPAQRLLLAHRSRRLHRHLHLDHRRARQDPRLRRQREILRHRRHIVIEFQPEAVPVVSLKHLPRPLLRHLIDIPDRLPRAPRPVDPRRHIAPPAARRAPARRHHPRQRPVARPRPLHPRPVHPRDQPARLLHLQDQVMEARLLLIHPRKIWNILHRHRHDRLQVIRQDPLPHPRILQAPILPPVQRLLRPRRLVKLRQLRGRHLLPQVHPGIMRQVTDTSIRLYNPQPLRDPRARDRQLRLRPD